MNELQQLLENQVLSEDVKNEVQTAFDNKLNEAKEQIRSELEVDYAQKLDEKIRESSQTAYDMINETVRQEIEGLKEDIEYYKNLELNYANRLEQFKEEYKEAMNESVEQFIKAQVETELNELRESIEEARKNEFGRKMFEAFQEEAQKQALVESEDSIASKYEVTKQQLQESQDELETLRREKKVKELLSDLEGNKRSVMETLLESVSTERLEERYNEVIDKVLQENMAPRDTDTDDPDQKTLNEKETDSSSDNDDDVILETEASKVNYDRILELSGVR